MKEGSVTWMMGEGDGREETREGGAEKEEGDVKEKQKRRRCKKSVKDSNREEEQDI